MGTIVARKRADGSKGYTAQIVRKKAGKIIHREAKTFDRKQAAEAWMKRRETELDEPGAIDRAKAPESSLANAIDRYIAESRKVIGRTKALRRIRKSKLSRRCGWKSTRGGGRASRSIFEPGSAYP